MAEPLPGPSLVLSLHDVCPSSWPAYERFLTELSAFHNQLSVTHLVVPNFHGREAIDRFPAFCQALSQRQDQGDELVLHGYYHADPGPRPHTPREWIRRRVLTHEGEFAMAGKEEAQERIGEGLRLFRHLGWRSAGFVAPGWLYSRGTVEALRGQGLRWYTDHRDLCELETGRHLRLPTLVWSARSHWRRALSNGWNRIQLGRFEAAPVLRLAIHPVDMNHGISARFWLNTVRELASRRRAVTKSALIGVQP